MATRELTRRDVIGKYFLAQEGVLQSSWVDLVSNRLESDQGSEIIKMLSTAPPLESSLGGVTYRNLDVESVTITNNPYTTGFEILKTDMRRDKTGQLDIRLQDLAVKGISNWRKLLTDLVINGETDLSADGSEFFSATHSHGDSGTQTNALTSAEVTALDVTTATAPTAAEASAAINGVISEFYGLKDYHGEPIHEDASQFLVMCPTTFGGAFRSAINKDLLASTVGSFDNPLTGSEWKIELAVNPRMDAMTTKFVVFRTDAATKAFIRQSEKEVEFYAIAEGSEWALENATHKYGISCNRGVGYGLWQMALLGTFS